MKNPVFSLFVMKYWGMKRDFLFQSKKIPTSLEIGFAGIPNQDEMLTAKLWYDQYRLFLDSRYTIGSEGKYHVPPKGACEKL